MHMEVRALFGRFVWRGVDIDDPQSILPEVRGSIRSRTQHMKLYCINQCIFCQF